MNSDETKRCKEAFLQLKPMLQDIEAKYREIKESIIEETERHVKLTLEKEKYQNQIR